MQEYTHYIHWGGVIWVKLGNLNIAFSKLISEFHKPFSTLNVENNLIYLKSGEKLVKFLYFLNKWHTQITPTIPKLTHPTVFNTQR